MRLFKYIGEYGVNVLHDQRVKLSAAHALNDPFELSPRIASDFPTIDRVLRSLSQDWQVDRAYELEGRPLGLTKKKFARRYRANLPQRAASAMRRIPDNVEGVRQRFAEIFSRHYRLLCVSKTRSSILMWSHYAKDHQGIVLEFDTTQHPFKQLAAEFTVEVAYADEKPSFRYYLADQDDFLKELLLVAGTKASQWSYEQEVRILFPCDPILPTDFVSFDTTAIRSVTFGCRCPGDRKNLVLKELATSRYRHVAVFQAALSKTDYKLEFNQLTPPP